MEEATEIKNILQICAIASFRASVVAAENVLCHESLRRRLEKSEYSVLKRPLIRNRIPTNRMFILSLLPRYRLAYRPPCSTTSQPEISLKPILVVDHSGWFYLVSFRGLKVSLTQTNGTNDAAPWPFQSGIFSCSSDTAGRFTAESVSARFRTFLSQ